LSAVERGIEGTLLIVICLVGFVGNVSLWTIILMRRVLRTSSNGLVLCLSGADLMVSTVNVPMTITAVINGRWIFSTSTCRAVGFLTMLTFITSVMSLGMISVNRFLLICHPRRFRDIYTPAKTGAMVAGECTVALSALLATPPLVGWGKYAYLPGQSICFCEWSSSISYTFFMVGMCFGGPCSVMTFCYVGIMREVRRSKKRKRKENQRQKKRQDDIRLTMSFVIVVFVFITSWLPFCVTMFLSVFQTNPIPRSADFATLLLGCANSCYNPLIYGVMNTKFRQGFKHLY
ncbi:hypothetical protein CAPTEDRAFT_34591, partial [Capitella teleta]